MSTSFDFSDRTVIVTGGGRGIGLALSRFFATAGLVLLFVSQKDDELA